MVAYGIEQRIGGTEIVHRDVEPNFVKIAFGLRRFSDAEQGCVFY